MQLIAVSLLVALAGSSNSLAPGAPGPDFPIGLIELGERPLRLAALEAGGHLDILLLRSGALERFCLRGRDLVRTGAFRAPGKDWWPLLLDAAPRGAGGASLVSVVFGEDLRSVDRGTDTRLHAFVLSARAEGELRPASADLGGWVRITDGRVLVQSRGMEELFSGPVRRVEETAGRWIATGPEIPWAGRWLLAATPLPGGAEALAWDGARPTIVELAGGARVTGGTILGDLGTVDQPRVAIRVDRPILRGIDQEGARKDTWHALPRRVSIGPDGAAYTVERGRSKSLLGKTSGQDTIVRLDWSRGALAPSRPYPGVDAFLIDFALVDRPGGRPVALLLVNEEEDGSGRAHLVFQEPRADPRP